MFYLNCVSPQKCPAIVNTTNASLIDSKQQQLVGRLSRARHRNLSNECLYYDLHKFEIWVRETVFFVEVVPLYGSRLWLYGTAMI